MLNKEAYLSAGIFRETIEKKATRDGFGMGVVEAGTANANVVVLSADLKESTRAEEFEKIFPERFIEMGVAEQNMATVAAGMSLAGKVPFITSYAAFSPGRNYEQIRTTIAINHTPVKICGMHAGVSVGPDGATHQMLEDIGLMRMLPGMTVIAPGDALEAHKAVVAAAKTDTPIYLRFGRAATPVFTTAKTPFAIGKAQLLFESIDPEVAIIATGAMSYEALLAARTLEGQGVGSRVLHMPTIKPLDRQAVLESMKGVRGLITVEEHQAAGGMGSAVAELVVQSERVPMRILGIQDQFGQSGTPEELVRHYGIDSEAIVQAARSLL